MAFMRIGQQVRALREKQGLSLRELAERVGTNHVSLHQIETGELYLASNFSGLARELGPEVTDLLRAESDLRHAVDRLRADAEKAASEIAADAAPVEVVWSGAADAPTAEQIAERLAAVYDAVPFSDLLTPAAIARRLGLELFNLDEDRLAVLEKASARWLGLMDVTE